MKDLIDADSEQTWPHALLNDLDRLQEEIFAYHVERRRIDEAAEVDVMLRVSRPSNPHQLAWTDAIQLANESISGHSLLGFHSTRLTTDEQREVKRSGLKPLSIELFQARLAAVKAAGQLTDNQFAILSARNQVREKNRSGMTWFCFSRASMRDEDAVGRLFRSWGGEALYNSHEDDDETGPLLRTIGAPCIVVAAVPIKAIETFTSVGKRLVNVWACLRGIPTGSYPEFEGYVRTRTPSKSVVRIIGHKDDEFLVLTEFDRWRKPVP